MAVTLIFCNHCGHRSADDAQFCQNCGEALSARPSSTVSLPQIAAPRYGGFWIRVVAAAIDFLLVFFAIFPVKLLLGSAVTAIGINAQMSVQEVFLVRRWVRICAAVLLVFAYRTGMESSTIQATLGKLATRLKVTDLEGRRISFSRATARYFAKYLSAFSLGLGYVMVGFDEQKQGLHDRIAGTLVQYR